MVYSRAEAKLAFTYILENVLGCGKDSLLWLALTQEGIDNIVALCHLTEEKIGLLRYNGSPIRLGDQMLLRCFLHYVSYCRKQGKPIGHDWDKITQEEFDQFRIHPSYMATLTPTFKSFKNDEFDLWGNILDKEELSDLVLEDDECNDIFENEDGIDEVGSEGTIQLPTIEEITFHHESILSSSDDMVIDNNTIVEQCQWPTVGSDWNPSTWENSDNANDIDAGDSCIIMGHSAYLDEPKVISIGMDSEDVEEIIFIGNLIFPIIATSSFFSPSSCRSSNDDISDVNCPFNLL